MTTDTTPAPTIELPRATLTVDVELTSADVIALQAWLSYCPLPGNMRMTRH